MVRKNAPFGPELKFRIRGKVAVDAVKSNLCAFFPAGLFHAVTHKARNQQRFDLSGAQQIGKAVTAAVQRNRSLMQQGHEISFQFNVAANFFHMSSSLVCLPQGFLYRGK